MACPKMYFLEGGFFVTCDIMISYIFSESVIEIPQVAQKIWRFYSTIIAIFENFLHFWTFHCHKKNWWPQYIADDVSIFDF